ncbi:site-specific integrase [Carboxylicivirga linearis]|uniref:Site-specific integrase n=1 Tax=Carboxylicivirga linearis TaxID=1628157 RepID=A0ABS5K1Y6_9BACT|nr:site-specific integrase [Carboxylicivirga linearis]MBS2101144.1 site-specific integrase [Carboxylicivirga linearis]
MGYQTKSLVKFNLKKVANTKRPFQIFLVVTYKGKRLRHYIGKRIEEKNWSPNKQRAKSQYSNATTLNAFLDKLDKYTVDEYNKYLVEGEVVNLDKLKEKINDFLNREDSANIISHFEEYIKISKNSKKPNTIKSYQTTLNHLEQFATATKYNLTYNTINNSFHEIYVDFLLKNVKLANSSIAKDIKKLKTFLNWATDKGYNKNINYQKFKTATNEGQIFFLTWDELIHLNNYDLEENERLKKIRDVFCFGCFTGMRFSDIMNLKHENIKDDYIFITTIKTSTPNAIPLNQYSRSIYNKYKGKKGNVFEQITNQKFNEYLKELGRLVKLKTQVQLVTYKGGIREEKMVDKSEILSSHIARKTFITNALAKGMKTEVIMDITTHKDYKVFKRYFKVVDEHKKSEMDKIFG